MRGADLIWSRLADAGITTCFANPGTSEMHLVSALDRAPSIRGILCLQENVATGAADGYGRMADRPAVTLLHLGPGLANGLANLHNARRARTPILNLVGDYNAEHRELDAPLASDIGSLARPMSDWVGEIRETSELPGVMIAAIDAASRGIATLTVGADVTWSECDDPQQSPAAATRLRAGLARDSMRAAPMHGSSAVGAAWRSTACPMPPNRRPGCLPAPGASFSLTRRYQRPSFLIQDSGPLFIPKAAR
ncbi:MAG: hypothetical protein J0H60_02435 [Rhizobiales bacterium]|nr:hypothetical protein [Hyphomicrobiales bacterium]